MILPTELTPFGSILKTHGLRGEIVVELDRNDCPADALRHVVLRIDGIYVPFRIASVRSRGTGAVLLTLDGVDSAEAAAEYVGGDVYALRRELPEAEAGDGDDDEGIYAEDLEGFSLMLPCGATVGTIVRVDTSTANTLLCVGTPDGRELLVPLAEDWICDINPEARTIAMDVPPALLENL